MNYKECLQRCKELDFNYEITKEILWNEAYRLGRARWYWGPSWFVSFIGWLNTQKSKIWK